jgi:hypothetical protein
LTLRRRRAQGNAFSCHTKKTHGQLSLCLLQQHRDAAANRVAARAVDAELDARFRAAIHAVAGRDADPAIRASGNAKFGDYQMNAAMALAKELGKSPRELMQFFGTELGRSRRELAIDALEHRDDFVCVTARQGCRPDGRRLSYRAHVGPVTVPRDAARRRPARRHWSAADR